jgi:hypothetical protein
MQFKKIKKKRCQSGKAGSRNEFHEEKVETNQEKMMTNVGAHYERTMARMDSQLQEMDTTILGANCEKLEAVGERKVAPKEEAVEHWWTNMGTII